MAATSSGRRRWVAVTIAWTVWLAIVAGWSAAQGTIVTPSVWSSVCRQGAVEVPCLLVRSGDR